MKTKGRRQSKNIDHADDSLWSEIKSRATMVGHALSDPANSKNGIANKELSDSMENALKKDKLKIAKKAMDRTVNARPEDPGRVYVETTMGFDKDHKSTGWKTEVPAKEMNKIRRKIQVTPGKWITK